MMIDLCESQPPAQDQSSQARQQQFTVTGARFIAADVSISLTRKKQYGYIDFSCSTPAGTSGLKQAFHSNRSGR